MYTGFAEVYDRLMADVDYAFWADFYVRLMTAAGISGGRICECACGTGNLSIPLQRRGYLVTGVDQSQDMLWIASQKARAAGLAIPFVCQDMRELRLHRKMDAVLATCDGVNYLLEDEDALAFFRAAREALRPGGGLFFDVSTPKKLSTTLGNRTICEDEDGITYIWQNRWHPKSQRVEMRLTFFVRKDNGDWRRIDEDQTQRAYEMDTLRALLTEAGFTRIAFFGNSHLTAPRPDEERWHVCALTEAESEAENP